MRLCKQLDGLWWLKSIYTQWNFNHLCLHLHRSWTVGEPTWRLGIFRHCSNARSLTCKPNQEQKKIQRVTNWILMEQNIFWNHWYEFWRGFSPEEIPYTTTNDLKTSNNGNHRLPMHEGEFEIQNRLDPRKSQQDIQDLNTCS